MDPKDYADNLGLIVTSGFVNAAIGIGKLLGLFEALATSENPVSSKDLAHSCNLKERYTEEWLGSMVASKIVFMDEEDKYYIPHKCKASLDSVNYSPCVLLLGELHKKTMECFKLDGPAGYDYEEMIPEIGEWLDSRLDWNAIVGDILGYLPSVKSVAEVTTVLEIGCGLGKLSRIMAKQLPNVEFYGVDVNPEYVKKSELFAEKENIRNILYSVHSAENFPENWTGKMDLVIMYHVLHDLAHPNKCMEEVKRILKDDGIAMIIDPNIHSRHKDNIGDINVAGKGYAISSFICLPCSSSEIGSAKLGMGWGEENKQTFLEENGWNVLDKRLLCNRDFQYMFTCVKRE